MAYNIYQTGVQTALSATTGAAVSLTIPTAAGTQRPTHAIIVVANNSIRWRADGTAPTASIGVLVPAGANIEFMDGAMDYTSLINNFKAIGISGSASLDVAFFAL